MSQQKLADTICVDRKTASRTLLSLLDHGVLLGEKHFDNERGFYHWVYSDIMFPLELEYGDGSSKDMVRRGVKAYHLVYVLKCYVGINSVALIVVRLL